MMKRLALVLAGAAMLGGCGMAFGQDGDDSVVQRSYTLGGFDRLKVAGGYEVDVRTGPAPSLQASGSERAIEQMVVQVEDGALSIHPRKRNGFSFGRSDAGPVRLALTVPNLRSAEIAGSGNIRVDRVAGNSFDGAIAGSGRLRLAAVEVEQLKMDIAGSGDFQAGGRARQASYDIAGSGNIDAEQLVAETATVSIAGAGNVRANASTTAAVDITGSGNVRMRGGARCTISKVGVGNVDCA